MKARTSSQRTDIVTWPGDRRHVAYRGFLTDNVRLHYGFDGWSEPVREAPLEPDGSGCLVAAIDDPGGSVAIDMAFTDGDNWDNNYDANYRLWIDVEPVDCHLHAADGGMGRLGATVVPASGGNTALQMQLLIDLGVDGLACTPSFAMLVAERAKAGGVRGLGVRYLVCGAEPWSEGFRQKLQALWSELTEQEVVARDIYGLSEVMGPGVAMECAENPGGLHIFDDHFLPEILDPLEQPVADGELGELVITTLTKEAQPVLRYRTGDVTSLTRGTCDCGRTHPRIGRIHGRTDDMLIIRGVNVFPREIETVIMEEPALHGAYAVVVDRRATMPVLEIHVEMAQGIKPRPELGVRLREALLSRLRVNPVVHLQPFGGLPRTEVGKVKRVYERVGDTPPF